MRPPENLFLEIEDEYTDFLWSNAQWYTDENGNYADDNKIPASVIANMTRSLMDVSQ